MFKMPFVEVGLTVHWFTDAANAADPMAAVVTNVGDNSISCSIVQDNFFNLATKSGVKHRSDPRAKTQVLDNDSGFWDHTPLTKRILDLLNDKPPSKTSAEAEVAAKIADAKKAA